MRGRCLGRGGARRGYASARILEALLESLRPSGSSGRGYTRNAAGKVFQAWRALTAALPALERGKIAGRPGDGRGRWLAETAMPGAAATRLKLLRQPGRGGGVPRTGAGRRPPGTSSTWWSREHQEALERLRRRLSG